MRASLTWTAGLVVALVCACYTGTTPPTPNAPVDSPYVATGKVKAVLTGLAPSDDEVRAVVADPNALGGLVDAWMKTPEYRAKLLTFFELAFQQTQISAADFEEIIPNGAGLGHSTQVPLLLQNIRESFARTVLALLDQGRPLTDALTTTSFMMTPPLMELYAYMDAFQANDAGAAVDRFAGKFPKQTITFETAQGPIDPAESIDPTSPNFMHWFYPNLTTITFNSGVPSCNPDPRVYALRAPAMHDYLYGALDLFKNPGGVQCGAYNGGKAPPSQFSADDFKAWRMITVRPPTTGEKTTRFYDVATLRTANELVLDVPRVGFFTTPAFFANWQTNSGNQMRVTINQTLIVATGKQVDGTDGTVPSATPGLDAVHAAQPACLFCHKTLDPSRAILASTYSYGYGNQTDATLVAQKGRFVFQGVDTPVGSVGDLGAVLATHPAFASAWVEKLCYWFDSRECSADDPELARIVALFRSSNYDFRTVIRALALSPLTTNLAPTTTTATDGIVVSMTRRDQLCQTLSARLGLGDVCGLDASTKGAPVATLARGLPSDGYGRGAPIPVLPTTPTLFYRAATENVCETVSTLVIDPKTVTPGAKHWTASSATNVDAAIGDLVAQLVGIVPSDPRSGPLLAELRDHYAKATATGASPTDALRSVFVLSCMAPTVVGIGM